MKQFEYVVNVYGFFDIELKEDEFIEDVEENHSFIGVLKWENPTTECKRTHEFNCYFDKEAVWDKLNNRCYQWQFGFGDECYQEMSVEMLFLELFRYLDCKIKFDVV